MRKPRLKVLLYNPCAVFFTMPLALLAIGSQLDPSLYEVVIIDGRLEADPERAVLAHLEGALCLGVTVLTGAPISDALRISRAAKRARPDLRIARHHCSKDAYHWLVEMLFSRALVPDRKVS